MPPSESPGRGLMRYVIARSSGDERPVAQLVERLLQLILRVHHDRTVPSDRLFDRPARDEQEADAIVARLDHHFVAAIEQNERSIAGRAIDRRTRDATVGLFGEH